MPRMPSHTRNLAVFQPQRDRGRADDGVLDRAGVFGLIVVGEDLDAFALPDWVVDERGDAVAREQDAQPLVKLVGLAVLVVAAGDYDAGVRARRERQEEYGGDLHAGEAFIHDLLVAEPVAFALSDGLGLSGPFSQNPPS